MVYGRGIKSYAQAITHLQDHCKVYHSKIPIAQSLIMKEDYDPRIRIEGYMRHGLISVLDILLGGEKSTH